MIARTQPTATALSARVDAALTKPPVIPAPEPGVYENIPSEVYHAWDAASYSRLARLRRSPAHLQAYIAEPPKDTTALIIGRAIHTAILEPDRFDDTFVVADTCTAIKKSDGQRCTNSGLTLHDDGWKCGQHNKAAGPADDSKLAISAADYAVCLGTRRSVYAHDSAAAMMQDVGRCELSIVWKDPETGLACKARFDRHALNISTGLIIDLKSSRDAAKWAFERSIATYGYHLQGAHYLAGAQAVGLRAHHFVNIPLEKEPPYAVATYRIVEAAIEVGQQTIAQLLRVYAKCRDTNTWPAYSQEVQDIGLPAYAWQQADDELRTMGTNYEVVP